MPSKYVVLLYLVMWTIYVSKMRKYRIKYVSFASSSVIRNPN